MWQLTYYDYLKRLHIYFTTTKHYATKCHNWVFKDIQKRKRDTLQRFRRGRGILDVRSYVTFDIKI